MIILKTEKLKKYYDDNINLVKALDGVDLEIQKGEFVSIVGTSGSGKSTLLHMLGGLDRATEEKVYVDGNHIFSMTDDELAVFRRRNIGFIFQSYNLLPILNVYENIVLPIELDGNKIDREHLDSKTSQEVLGLLKITSEKFNQTIVMITHNEEIAQLADRIIRIEGGKIARGDK